MPNAGQARVRLNSTQPMRPSAVLIDGSALYLATRSFGEAQSRLNYRTLIDILVREVTGLRAPHHQATGTRCNTGTTPRSAGSVACQGRIQSEGQMASPAGQALGSGT